MGARSTVAFRGSGVLLAGLLAALATTSCARSDDARAEHVLLVVIDTLRADHLSAYGYPRPTSPRLDQLAGRGVLCANAISQCSWTSPSMISLMTGRYIAQERLDIPADLTTLGEAFSAAGWATAGFCSNELVTRENGFARGFDRFEWIDEHNTNEPIERWLAESRGRRTLTYVHITEPHDPYEPPEDQQRWRGEGGFLPGDRAEYYAEVTGELGLKDTGAMQERIEREIGGYDDEVRSADARVGRLLDAFEQAGLLEDTVVVVTADHGEGLWERVAMWNGPRAKAHEKGEAPTLMNTLHQTHGNQVTRELVHVPLILAGPGLPRGKVIPTLVENLDLYPTLLELTGLRPPAGVQLQGQSLLRRLDGSPDPKQAAFSYTRYNLTVIDPEGWTLILPTAEGECAEGLTVQLYRLGDDPEQRHDLSAEQPQVVERLKEDAKRFLRGAISASGAVSDADLHAFNQLGYGGLADREQRLRELRQKAAAQIVALLADFKTPCQERLLAAQALVGRELDEASRAKLAEWRDDKETSTAVKGVIDQLLGG